jgi:biopolymer transport protein ExbD
MKLRTAEQEEPDVNLTSLIDVVLLLLVFFMVTTSFVRESQIAIRLPEATTSAAAALTPPVEISISAGGDYRVNGRALVDNQPATLAAAISQLVDGLDSAPSVTISADAQASHQSVVTAMDIVGRLGFSEISIATVRAAGESARDGR